MKLSNVPPPQWYLMLLFLFFFKIVAMAADMYLIVILICISLRIDDADHLIMSYLPPIYLYWFICSLIAEFWEIFVCSGYVSVRYMFGKYVLQSVTGLFIILPFSFEEQTYFTFMKFNLSNCSFMVHAFSVLRNFCLIQSYKDAPCFLVELVYSFNFYI